MDLNTSRSKIILLVAFSGLTAAAIVPHIKNTPLIVDECNKGVKEACQHIFTVKPKRLNAVWSIQGKEIISQLRKEDLERKKIIEAKKEEERQREIAKKEEERQKEIAKELEKAREAKKQADEEERERALLATFGDWQYATFDDLASGKTYKSASLRSENSINLDFPYSGAQKGTLSIRRHPRWGFDIYLRVEKGQIISTSSWDNKTMVVRFDNEEVNNWRYNDPADNSSDYIFVSSVDRFYSKLLSSEKIYITINMFQAGQRTFVFKVKGFDPNKV